MKALLKKEFSIQMFHFVGGLITDEALDWAPQNQYTDKDSNALEPDLQNQNDYNTS